VLAIGTSVVCTNGKLAQAAEWRKSKMAAIAHSRHALIAYSPRLARAKRHTHTMPRSGMHSFALCHAKCRGKFLRKCLHCGGMRSI